MGLKNIFKFSWIKLIISLIIAFLSYNFRWVGVKIGPGLPNAQPQPVSIGNLAINLALILSIIYLIIILIISIISKIKSKK